MNSLKRTVLLGFSGGRTAADLRAAALRGEGSSKDLSEITCWIAWDLFHEGRRIPVKPNPTCHFPPFLFRNFKLNLLKLIEIFQLLRKTREGERKEEHLFLSGNGGNLHE